ncbi:MAG: hypothetical protein ACREN8_09280 [Candidatus Dormibacteraceae bacterium]
MLAPDQFEDEMDRVLKSKAVQEKLVRINKRFEEGTTVRHTHAKVLEHLAERGIVFPVRTSRQNSSN